MKMKSKLLILFLLTYCFLAGCGGQTKAFIPDNFETIPDGYARIVVTREHQLAGALTPIYILDVGQNIEANADIALRIGEFKQGNGLSMSFSVISINKNTSITPMVLPTTGISFKESSDIGLKDLIDNNANAIIFVDHLKCNLKKPAALYCGDSKSRCDSAFEKKLNKKQGVIVSERKWPWNSIADGKIYRVQVVGSIMRGETIIWDRKPGVMRVGAIWGAMTGDQDLLLTQGNIVVDAGRTYYLHYTINSKERWKITKIE